MYVLLHITVHYCCIHEEIIRRELLLCSLQDVSEDEQLALQVISYIGCIISTICLSITVVFYLAMGYKQ